jgi:hypothetical protein
MTTSEPQAGRRDDDDSREHRSIGQRIRDAVLGDPADDQHDAPAGGGYAGRETAHNRPDAPVVDQGEAPGEAGYAQPAGGYTAPRSDPADPAGTYAETDRRPDAVHDAGYADRERGLEGAPGYADDGPGDPHRTDVASGAGYADPRGDEVGRGDLGRDEARRGPDADNEYAPYEQAMREHAQGGEHLQGGRVPDPVRDDVTQEGVARRVDDRGGYTDRDALAAPTAGQAGTGYDDRAERSEGAYADTRTDTVSGDRDFVTSSYDPDRDTGYDPHAAGTAMAGSGATGAAGAVRDRDDRDDRDVRGRQARDYDNRDYDPATDTGYAGEGRVDTDRATGRGDADYDTGRVDAGERDSGRGAGAGTAAAVAGGAVAAAAAGVAAHHRRDDRGDEHRGEGRFSDVDDTATVDPTPTGRATPDTAGSTAGATAGTSGDTAGDTAAADRRAEAVADEADESHSAGGRERLVPADRAHDYSSRWDALKGDFVDEPRRAVAQADDLVGELLDEIQRLFADQRRDLEQGFDHDRASTEDLRLALRRYRSFFDRLLSF